MAILNDCPSTRITEVTSKIEGYFGLFSNRFFKALSANGPCLHQGQGQRSNDIRFNDYSKTRYFY